MIRRPPRSALFPCPTLSRSGHDDRAVVPTTSRHVFVIDVGGEPRVEQDFDLTGHVASGDSIISALPDWSGRLWFASRDRKSTRLNSSHANISYAVFCLKKTT